MARIADFLILGEGVWWHKDGEIMVFHDSNKQPSFRKEGPLLAGVHAIISAIRNKKD